MGEIGPECRRLPVKKRSLGGVGETLVRYHSNESY